MALTQREASRLRNFVAAHATKRNWQA
jgi:hypothetical protein